MKITNLTVPVSFEKSAAVECETCYTLEVLRLPLKGVK